MYRICKFWHCSVMVLAIILFCSGNTLADKSNVQLATTAPPAPAKVDQASLKVTVFYLTNRKRYEDKPVDDTYSGERGKAHFGRCEVEFKPIPIINQFATKMPFYIKSETNKVSLVEQVDSPLFWEQLVAAVKGRSTGSVVLFVHGYNYGFERTCRMAAEMQRSLQDKATVVAFSWPSNALPTDYVRDQADIEWSVPLLANFIGKLGDRIGRDNIKVVAHSMGSRGVIFALQRMSAKRTERPVIGQLVLFAPDFDSQTFVDLMPEFVSLVGGITLYASDNDTLLKLSHQVSGYPRLGEAGEYLTVVKGMDTIDVSSTGRYQVTGHEYFYFNPLVVADLVKLLGSGATAAKRPRLQPKTLDGIRYWEFMQVEGQEGSGLTSDKKRY